MFAFFARIQPWRAARADTSSPNSMIRAITIRSDRDQISVKDWRGSEATGFGLQAWENVGGSPSPAVPDSLCSVLLPGIPRAQDLSGDPVWIGVRNRLELLHAAIEAIGQIQVPELIGRHAV